MSDCQICGHDIDNHGRSGCCAHGCSCLRTYARTDHPNYAEQDARIAALTEQVSQADRANGELLRRLQAAEDETHLFATELADKKCLGLETIQRLEDKIIALTERTERARGEAAAGCVGSFHLIESGAPPMTPTEAMTTDQLRDWCAEDDGWVRHLNHWHPDNVEGMEALRHKCHAHPHPPTLDGAAKAMPEGYAWERWAFDWVAWKHGSRVGGPAVRVPDTGVEIADRFRLAVLCRMAAREVKG